MFKLNYSVPQKKSYYPTFISTPVSNYTPTPYGNLSFSVATGSTRSMASMGMNIANLKSSRGCSACGK